MDGEKLKALKDSIGNRIEYIDHMQRSIDNNILAEGPDKSLQELSDCLTYMKKILSIDAGEGNVAQETICFIQAELCQSIFNLHTFFILPMVGVDTDAKTQESQERVY